MGRIMNDHLPLPRAASRYAARGWYIFPLGPRGKKPLVDGGRGFHDASCDPDIVAAWWRATPDANIGLAPGRSGLLVLDVDGPDGEAAAGALGLRDVSTLTCTTGRAEGGRHLYFAHPGFPIGNFALAVRLDVRCDRGYVVVPPSIHPSGALYRWTAAQWPLPSLSEAILDVIRARQTPVAPVFVPPRAVDDRDALETRVAAYVRVVGPRSEGGRNNAAFQLAAWLLRDMALTPDLAWIYLAAWNGTNTPPLTERELRACFVSARKHGRRTVGAGRERNRSRPLPRVVRPFADATTLAAQAQPYIGANLLPTIVRPGGGAA